MLQCKLLVSLQKIPKQDQIIIYISNTLFQANLAKFYIFFYDNEPQKRIRGIIFNILYYISSWLF